MTSLIDSTVEQRSGLRNNITTYFRDMSNGRLEVIGTTRYVRAAKPLANYASSTKIDGTPEPEKQSDDIHKFVFRDVLNRLDQTLDFAPFDNYTTGLAPGADSTVDLVIFVYRSRYGSEIIPELRTYSTLRAVKDKDRVALDQGVRRVAGYHILVANGRDFPDGFRWYLNEIGSVEQPDNRLADE